MHAMVSSIVVALQIIHSLTQKLSRIDGWNKKKRPNLWFLWCPNFAPLPIVSAMLFCIQHPQGRCIEKHVTVVNKYKMYIRDSSTMHKHHAKKRLQCFFSARCPSLHNQDQIWCYSSLDLVFDDARATPPDSATRDQALTGFDLQLMHPTAYRHVRMATTHLSKNFRQISFNSIPSNSAANCFTQFGGTLRVIKSPFR